jgi:hypothetical protein
MQAIVFQSPYSMYQPGICLELQRIHENPRIADILVGFELFASGIQSAAYRHIHLLGVFEIVPVAFEHIYFKPMYYRYPTASNGRVFLM